MNAWRHGYMTIPSQLIRLPINTPFTIRSNPQA